MTTTSLLIFRPNLTHRIIAAILCIGSCMAGVRGLIFLLKYLPKLIFELNQTKTANESTLFLWSLIVILVLFCFISGFLLVFCILGLILIESTNVIVDKTGITVEYLALPNRLAIYFGAGHLLWKHVLKLEKNIIFFTLHGKEHNMSCSKYDNHKQCKVIKLKFIIVDELDRLILTILERSPNLII